MSTTKKTQTQTELDRYLNNGSLPKATEKSESMKALDRYYAEGTELAETYATAQEQLNESRRVAQEKAGVAYETAKKYLPIQSKMNGLGGLGVSESVSTDAYNKYLNQMGTIEQQHGSDSAALLQNYLAEKRTQQTAEQDALYQEAMATLQSGTYNGTEDIDNYVKSMSGKLSDTQMGNLQYLANYIKNNPNERALMEETAESAEQAAKEKEYYSAKNIGAQGYQVTADLSKNGKNFTVATSDGRRFNVQSAGKVEDQSIVNAALNIDNNGVFAYGGSLYYKQNGKIYLIESRNSKNHRNVYNQLYSYFYG